MSVGIRRVGSHALLAEAGGLEQVLALRGALEADRPRGVRELVAAARTLLVTYDPAVTAHQTVAAVVTERAAALGPAERSTPGTRPAGEEIVTLPVRYDGEDLSDVAELTGLGVGEVIARHTAPLYTVAFAGFAPGFGYLTGTDPLLRLPRRSEPRTAVPAGSVAVAGGFTGVYPRSSPGGWQLLGTTDAVLWDERRDPPALLVPGSHVRFVPEEIR
ncbi:allophanate hydrolase [Streptomyces sp. NTH33]|uniref:5-oxoprolinase subunit B family protein n=1 Tax=Streptomyces sp. NTH33 TaxID=1735453 RepID=UPI000DA6E927|nr:allophanate hydrolase subunit 1 [Streptomyces sp. NTH33]PZH03326.1 allophanate hydrolase [Streptomyces sp. NTH33]